METENSRPQRGWEAGMPGPKPEGASPGAQHGTAAAAKLLIRARAPGLQWLWLYRGHGFFASP